MQPQSPRRQIEAARQQLERAKQRVGQLPSEPQPSMAGALSDFPAALSDLFEATDVLLRQDEELGEAHRVWETQRKQLEAILERGKKEWEKTFDAISDWILLVDTQGRILRTNRAGERFARAPLRDIIGQSCCQLIHGSQHPIPDCPLQRALVTRKRETAEFKAFDGENWLMITADPVIDEDGSPVGAVHTARRITERKRVETELREASQRRQALVKSSPLAIVALDSEGRVTLWNPAAERIFGWTELEALGRLHPFMPQSGQAALREQMQRVIHGEAFSGMDVLFQRKDGSLIDISLSTAPLLDDKGQNVGAMLMLEDITRRKQAEKRILGYQKQLRLLASQLLLAEEQERRRIATELHDRIAQSLGSARIKLGMLKRSAPAGGFSEAVQEIDDLIEQTVGDTRSLTFELSPPVLYELGFEAAMSWLAEHMHERYGLACEVQDDKQAKPITEEVRVLLYRAARELLTNVVKHAHARHVRIVLRRQDENVRIIIEDDGVGFDPSTIDAHSCRLNGFGLFNIRERLDHIGGKLEMESAPGRGARACLTAPLSCVAKDMTGGKPA